MRRIHKDPRLVQLRVFVCAQCGASETAPKRRGHTGRGHIKTFWCRRCRARTRHIQIE